MSIISQIKANYSCLNLLRKSEHAGSKENGGFICPACDSGIKTNKTGAVTYNPDERSWYCHACTAHGDVLDLYQLINKVDLLTAIRELSNRANIPLSFSGQDFAKPKDSKVRQVAPAKPSVDYLAYCIQSNQNLGDLSSYRGIPRSILDDYLFGYDPSCVHPNSPRMQPKPCYILFIDNSHYLIIDARPNLTPEQKKYSKLRVGNDSTFFNQHLLSQSEQPVFIVEGEVDALSIITAGGIAIALGGTNGVPKFIKLCQASRPKCALIIALDNDPPGRKAAASLLAGLKAANIPCAEFNVSGQYKDANDLLRADPEALSQNIQKARRHVCEVTRASITDFVCCAFAEFYNATTRPRQAIPTGFTTLNNLLDGGLYPGLYILGAISSFGKTTFALQIADYVASQHYDALIFSLEMSKNELIAKSISRLSYQASIAKYGSASFAKTTREILYRANYNFSNDHSNFINNLFWDFQHTIAEHLAIIEGVGNVTIETIRARVESYIAAHIHPVVFIDYLQIMAPIDQHSTDKQNVDKTVTELKRLSRDFNLPIIAISSFNRASYRESASMEAFKESGAIEYSSDVLLALQFKNKPQQNASEQDRKNEFSRIQDDNNQRAAKGEPQEIEVKVLKNRNGCRGEIYLDFHPKYNVFINRSNSPSESDAKELYRRQK